MTDNGEWETVEMTDNKKWHVQTVGIDRYGGITDNGEWQTVVNDRQWGKIGNFKWWGMTVNSEL